MFDLSGGDTGKFGDFQETFGSFCPNAKITAVHTDDLFAWNGKLFSQDKYALWQMQCNRGWTAQFDGGHRNLSVIIPLVGCFDAVIQNKSLYFEPGKAFLAGETDLSRMSRCHGKSFAHVALNWKYCEATKTLASLFPDACLREVELLPTIDLTSPYGHVFDTIAKAFTRGLREHATVPLQALELLSEAALQVLFSLSLPHLKDNAERLTPNVLPRNVRCAVDYMHANLSAPIRIQDIAEACGVSVRAIEHGFNTYMNTSPATHLRKLRLNAARDELLDPNDTANISEIAYNLGFMSCSRFSKMYRLTYGEAPSETRRRKSHRISEAVKTV